MRAERVLSFHKPQNLHKPSYRSGVRKIFGNYCGLRKKKPRYVD